MRGTQPRAVIPAGLLLLLPLLAGCMPETPMQARITRTDEAVPEATQTRAFLLTLAAGEGAPVDGSVPDGTGGVGVTVMAEVVGSLRGVDPQSGDTLEFEVRLDGSVVGSAVVPLPRSLGYGDPTPDAITFTVDCPAGASPCSGEVTIEATAHTVSAPLVDLAYILRADHTVTNRRGEHEATRLGWTLRAP